MFLLKLKKAPNPPQPAELDPSAIEKSGNLAIHVMPQNFRRIAAKQSGKMGGIFILTAGFLAMAGIAAAGYYFFLQPGSTGQDSQPGLVATGTPEENAAQLPDLNKNPEEKEQETEAVKGKALERYLKFRTDIGYIGDLDDYQALVKNFGSQDYQDKWKEAKAKLDGASDEAARNFIKLLKNYYPKKEALVANLEEKTANTSITLLKMRLGNEDFSVTMSMENNKWYIDKETGIYYISESGSTTTLEAWLDEATMPAEEIVQSEVQNKQLVPGQDSDNDGLTDKEETLIGSDLKNSDSDGDGYGDYTEFMNLFNPAGQGKLQENSNFKEYYNPTFGYRVIVPVFWTNENIGGDDSIIIKTQDGQFIQAIITPNAERQEIEEWFKKQFNTTEVNLNSVFDKRDASSSAIWRGVKNESGLTAYLTDSKKEQIYTFSYNIGQSNVLDYINIYNAMIKSLSL